MIPVSVLTGFLGSGKTTLLACLLRHPAFARTAVIINEFGEVGLDHDLVEASDESFIALKTGCLCCRLRGDLATTLEDLARRRDAGSVPAFERVVIETSGLADPVPVLHALLGDEGVARRYTVSGVVTTVDAVGGMRTLDEHPHSVRQAAIADRIVITKTDLLPSASGVAPPAPSALDARIRALNPSAPLLQAVHGLVDPAVLFDVTPWQPPAGRDADRWLAGLQATAPGAPLDIGNGTASGRADARALRAHDDRIRVHTLLREAPMASLTLTLFLEALMEQAGGDVLRLKGLVRLAEDEEHPVAVHAVQHLLHPLSPLPRWPSSDRRTRLVVITRDIPRAWIDALLDTIESEVTEAGAAGCA